MTEPATSTRDDLCWSRGPRVGSEGHPYCLLKFGHTGLHISHPESGFTERWGDPLCRANPEERATAWIPKEPTMPEPFRPELDEAALTHAGLAFLESPSPANAIRMRDAIRAYLYTAANIRDDLYPSWHEVRTYLEEARNT